MATADREEVLDVVHDPTSALPRLELAPATTHVVFVSGDAYERDLRGALPTALDAMRQLRVDAPRCSLRVDGALATAAPPRVDAMCARFMTQAVLGLPVCMVHRCAAGWHVCEASPPSRMTVDVWADRHVWVSKRLALHDPVTMRAERALRILVEAELGRPWHVVRIVCE